MKSIYVVRHCEAEGQPAEAPLTESGVKQADDLVDFFKNKKVERIISSPYKRAIQTIQPLANQLQLEIEKNPLLKERELSTDSFPDWLEKLKTTYDDLDLKFKGGESSSEAANRIKKVVDEIGKSKPDHTIIVTHGNIMSLLLNHYDSQFGFDRWANLSNPDVYLLKIDENEVAFERVWS
ncbi:histidine phosphatase family protein [Bacillus alkalicellulosilyticus]|uniref:histidine phosphatase family protein n=1 Tax=Alkalihalobacterium alkalicellulosilyticum TaxID=1912214 RepID=UPI000997D5FD|nr:histidine phosphatase family protein [Bacillus alkalicellulosilyticus]